MTSFVLEVQHMKRIVGYFIQGLLILVPVALTLFVIFKIIELLSSMFTSFGIIVHPVVDFFILLGVVFALILLVGFMGSSFFFQPLFSLVERALVRAPLIKIVYSSIKDFMNAFVGNKKRFSKPVLVQMDKDNNVQQMGFITQQNLESLGISEARVAVYMPFSYAFTGRLIFVPRDRVTPVNISSTEAMKFIVSGGVTEVD